MKSYTYFSHKYSFVIEIGAIHMEIIILGTRITQKI